MTYAEGAEQPVPGRRFLIAAGVGSFRNPGLDALPGVEADVRRVRALLEPLGYQSVLPALAHDPTRDAVADGIEDWTLETCLGPEDVVVVYFAGHGVCEEDRHYLLCADSRPDRWSRALAAEDLARPLVKSKVGHLLVMLDTCYAAAGTTDISRLALGLADLHRGRANRWHLAAARAKERAKENVFIDALSDVFAHPRHGATQRYMSVREVTERVNDYFKIHRPRQQARLTTTETDGQDPFFPSPLFIPGLPADGIDLASIAGLRRRHTGHFGPRSRGVEHAGERGDYFTGRTRALRELTAFLTTPSHDHDRKARVITGDPGSGKSALLGRLLTLTDPDASAIATSQRAPGAGRPSMASPSLIALHARRVTLDDLVTDLASALSLPAPACRDDVLSAVAIRTTPLAVVVDSLDEAGTAGDTREGNRIARELLQPLSTLSPVRLVVGTRRPQIPSLGHAVHLIDLDLPTYITQSDIAAYARALLEDTQDPDSLSPYRQQSDLAATIADGIAERAHFSYLVARMTARALVHGQIHIDTTRPGWRERLPSDAREAFAAYLDRFGPERSKIERLLRPLAYTQGAGLPWSTIWAPVAEALSGLSCPQDDLDWLHQRAGAYIVETPTPDGSAYRLFHETMAEHLRRTGHEHDDHATIAHTLTTLVPQDQATSVNNWHSAHPYIRHHVATHAAAGGALPILLNDPEYLVHAHPTTLLRALDTATSPAILATAAVYRASADAHTQLDPPARRDILAIDAARYQQPQLATHLARTRPWTPRWATGTLVNPAHRTTLTGHTGPVRAVAVAEIDNRPHAVTTGDDKTLRVWDLTSGTERAVLTGHTNTVTAVAVAEIDNRPHAVTTSYDETVRVWDLASGTERAVLTGHTNTVTAVAVAEIDNRPHAVTAGDDETVRVWDLASGTERAVLTGHTNTVTAVAVAEIDNRPHAVTAGDDETVWVWDLTSGTERAVLTGHTNTVTAVAVAEIDNRPHAVTTSYDKTVRVWDLTSGTERAVLTGHSDWVTAVAVAEIDNRPHAVTAGDDETVRVWDLTSGTERAVLTGHSDWVLAVAVAEIDNRPHAVTTSYDETVRVWDLTSGTERAVLTGHSDWVLAVAVAEIDNRPHAVTTSYDETVRVWDLTSGTERAVLTGHTGWVEAVAVAEIDNRPHAVTTSYDETVRVWDLTSGTERAVLTGHTAWVRAVAVAEIDNRPHAVTAGDDETVRVWDLTSGTERAVLTGHTNTVTAVAVAEIDNRPHAVTAGDDKTVRVWDLTSGTERAVLTGHTAWVRAVAVAEIDNRPHAVTAGDDRAVRVWDLTSGTERAVLTGHTASVNAIAVAEIDNRPHAVTTSDDKTVRMWDLHSTHIAVVLSQPLGGNAIAAHDDYIVLGMANEVVTLQPNTRGK
ncbi:caspase family protein [Streptomyces sp. NBC_00208]|uniref:caspase family protein n=1 Tax=Streptomyces sp. NBC_00208 TaxID=2975681 RepID=UPI002E2A4F25|nr:caspase family protein [Streptomyces sp. NBC_00208]